MVFAQGNANKYRYEISPFNNPTAKRTPPTRGVLGVVEPTWTPTFTSEFCLNIFKQHN